MTQLLTIGFILIIAAILFVGYRFLIKEINKESELDEQIRDSEKAKEWEAKREIAAELGHRAHEEAEKSLLTTSNLYMEMMKRIPKSTFNRRFKGVESKTLIDQESLKMNIEDNFPIEFKGKNRTNYLQKLIIPKSSIDLDELALVIMEFSRSSSIVSTIDTGSADKPNPFYETKDNFYFCFTSRYKSQEAVSNRVNFFMQKEGELKNDALQQN